MRPPGATVWYPIERPSKRVTAGWSVGSACPLAGTGCQKDGPLPGWTTTAWPRTASCFGSLIAASSLRLPSVYRFPVTEARRSGLAEHTLDLVEVRLPVVGAGEEEGLARLP